MGSLLVGIDLVRISNIAASIGRFGTRFLERVFTPAEIRYCGQNPHVAAQRYAARFAAKEATMKVLRPLDEAVPFRSIEVRGVDGHPELELYGAAQQLASRARITSLAVSLSHELDYATAVVVAQIASQTAGSRLSTKRALNAPRRRSLRTYRNNSGSER